MPETRLRAIVGLGNPGAEYEHTRHNAGFWFVDALAEAWRGAFRTESKFLGAMTRIRINDVDVLVLKPATFMNRSGQAIQALAAFYKLAPADILVAHDELDLPAGTVRLKRGGGHGGHNGLRSVHQHLGEDHLRLRLGVGHPGHKDLVLNYLTGQRIGKTDEELVTGAIAAALSAIPVWLGESLEKAMQQLHSDK